jgi:uncharacterized protein involved in exopolysaccharide biosynthesis
MAYDIAIPEEDTAGFGDYLDALRRRKKSAIIIAVLILAIGATIVMLLPNRYQSSATILIEQPEVPPGLVPTTVTTFAAQQLNYITQRVMTRTNLAGIIEKFDLYAEEREYLPTLMLVEDVQKDMSIDLIEAQAGDAQGRAVTQTIAFGLGFEHESPQTAQKVANELVSLYLAENVRARTVQTAETSDFVQAEVDRLDAEVKVIEQEVATFKEANEGSLPQQAQLNLQMIQRTDTELLNIQRQIESIEESMILIESQLAQVNPMAPSILPDGRTVVAPEDQLKALQTQQAMLEGRYSPDHPDVLRIRREIRALEQQLGIEGSGVDLAATNAALSDARSELAMAEEKYGPDHPEVAQLRRTVASLEERAANPTVMMPRDKAQPDNPAYIQLSTQLRTLEADKRALQAQAASLRQKLTDYEERMMRGSEVERQLSAMTRRLSTATTQYLQARDKLFSAQMGQALETQSKGERFTLVEPPDQPLVPSSPNRPVLLALCIVLALAAGLGWPQVAATMDAAIAGPKSIERIFGAPPIAEIPLITTAADASKTRNTKLVALLLIPAAIAAMAVAVHFFFMPLDVLWYVAMRRFGL